MATTKALSELRESFDSLTRESIVLDTVGCYPRVVVLVSRMAGLARAIALLAPRAERRLWENEQSRWEGRGSALVGKPCRNACVFCRGSAS